MTESEPTAEPAYDLVVVSPNSALDSYYILPELVVGSVNRAERSYHTAGGKGNNLSRAVKALGGKSLSLGILGGHAGRFVAAELNREQIPYDVVWIDRETRRSATMIIPGQKQTTVALDAGCPVSPEDGEALLEKVDAYRSQAPYLVLTGSLPRGLDENYYARLIQRLAGQGAPMVCIDSTGGVLKQAVLAGPAIIKVNTDEFQSTFGDGQEWSWQKTAGAFTRLQDCGVELLIITAGPRGAYVFPKDGPPYNVSTRTDRVLTTAGAGDAFLAGLVMSLRGGRTLEQAVCFGSAAAAANLLHVVCGELELHEVEAFLAHTVITPLE